MTATFFLDTNIISHMMLDGDGAAARRAIQVLTEQPDIDLCTSIVVQCELLYGLRKCLSPRLERAYELQMRGLKVISMEEADAPVYAQLRNALESNGTPLGPNDMLIAAQAMRCDATLVSADAAFARVPGLKLQNWLA
ncbi:PIN domain-containing protein [Limnohabitans sp.]|uniref:PIN domain-containing protein n=1 Tax=Limnohabitans sp. TaxID=1907725 RepID=UPI0039BD0228|nr:PIN domain-containing protein [Comamonadaceae bacterium]